MNLLQSIIQRNAEADRPESFDESAFHGSKKLPALKPLYKDSLALQPVMLKSALFRPASGARVTHLQPTVIPSHSHRVLFTGEELRQDDQRVLLMLLKQRLGQEIDNVLTFVPRVFVREVLGWADSSDSVAKLRACIDRLQTARVRIEYAVGGHDDYSFITDTRIDAKGHSWSIWLSTRLVAMFKHAPTYLPMAERLALRDGMDSWLYGFVKADACLTPFLLSDMRDWSGRTNYEQKNFNRELKADLERMCEHKVIASYAFNKKKVMIYKTAPTFH